jgi:hypothetical protein
MIPAMARVKPAIERERVVRRKSGREGGLGGRWEGVKDACEHDWSLLGPAKSGNKKRVKAAGCKRRAGASLAGGWEKRAGDGRLLRGLGRMGFSEIPAQPSVDALAEHVRLARARVGAEQPGMKGARELRSERIVSAAAFSSWLACQLRAPVGARAGRHALPPPRGFTKRRALEMWSPR